MLICKFTLCFKDFAMRSLKIIEDGDASKDAVRKYEIKEGRKWDERYSN